MARTQARIFTSIWHNDEFLAMTASAQRLFLLALSQETLSFCGVVGYTAKRWAKLAKDTTVTTVKKDIAEAASYRFIMVDEDTEEIWVRSFMRHDGIYKSPNLIRAMIRDYKAVHSASISQGILTAVHNDFPDGFRQHLIEFPKGFEKDFPEDFCKVLEERFVKGVKEGIKEGVSTHAGARSASTSVLLPRPHPSNPSPEGLQSDDDDGGTVGQALRVLAERDLADREATKGPVRNREAWLTKAVRVRRDRHGDQLVGFEGLSAEEIVAALDPPVDVDSGSESVAAFRALAARSDLPHCEECDDSGWVTVGDGPAVAKCGVCRRLIPEPDRELVK